MNNDQLGAVSGRTDSSKPNQANTPQELEPWREELNRIVTFLNEANHYQVKKLWAVLSALRGPDSDNFEQKIVTTAVIRHAIGLSSNSDFIVREDGADNQVMRQQYFPTYLVRCEQELERWEHFAQHALLAFRALGLKW